MGRPVGGPVTDPDQGDGGWAMAQASLGERWWDGGCVLRPSQQDSLVDVGRERWL